MSYTNFDLIEVRSVRPDHRAIYARDYGFDDSFALYVEEPLTLFVKSHTGRERLWIVDQPARIGRSPQRLRNLARNPVRRRTCQQ